MNIKTVLYKGWKVYFPDKYTENIELGKCVVDNNFEVENIIKDTERNYVALVIINNKKYILKEIRAEINLIQRKVQTFLKKGEALTTLTNYYLLDDSIKPEVARPYVVVIKKSIFIKKSYILLEYIDGVKIQNNNDIDKVVSVIKNIHKLKRYHGDLNTSNFLKKKDGEVVTFDTQLKKEIFSNFKRSYDILNMKEDLLVIELGYDLDKKYKIEKKIGYIIAYLIKRIKKMKVISKFRELKRERRIKRWKI